MTHKASIGRIVHYYQGDYEAPAQYKGVESQWPGTNGSRFHPAIITRAWTDDCVNLHVLWDAHPSEVRCSMTRLPDEVFAGGVHCANSGWRWPERV